MRDKLSARENRFCSILAQSERDGEPLTLVDAYCESAEGFIKPDPTPGLRVSASRMHARLRVQKRLEELSAQFAAEKTPAGPVQRIDAQSIAGVMNDITEALHAASVAAKEHGAANIARSLQKCLTVHIGRVRRVDARTETAPPDTDTDAVNKMRDAIWQTPICTCGG